MMTAGDLIWIEFPGIVQTKRRPAVVLSSSLYHSTRPDVIVGLITSQTNKANAPSDYQIVDWQNAGLRVPSAFRAFIVTLPQASVFSTIGTLSASDWQNVITRVKTAIELN
jgi:mRNA interferase MazF